MDSITAIIIAKVSEKIITDAYEKIKAYLVETFGEDIAPLKCYHIVSKHSGKCLDVSGWQTDNGVPIQQWSYHGGDNQKWKLVPESS